MYQGCKLSAKHLITVYFKNTFLLSVCSPFSTTWAVILKPRKETNPRNPICWLFNWTACAQCNSLIYIYTLTEGAVLQVCHSLSFGGVFISHSESDSNLWFIAEFLHRGSPSEAVSWALLPNYLGQGNENHVIGTENMKKGNQVFLVPKCLQSKSRWEGSLHLHFWFEITGSSAVQGTACSSSLSKSAPEPSL